MASVNPPSWTPVVSQTKFFKPLPFSPVQPVVISEEDGDWWTSVQQCGAYLALAISLSLGAQSTGAAQQVFNYQQDELPQVIDEVYWQNPVPPIPDGYAVPQQWIYDEQIPTGSLFSGAEEYYWQNPVAPIASYPAPFLFTDDVVIVPQPTAFQPDEDFWANPVAPVPLVFALISPWQDKQTPLLFGQPDEDFWISGVAPQLWPLWTTPFSDDEIIVTQPTVLSPDEDFWQNPVAPQQWVNIVPQRWIYDEQTSALFGQLDEDFWINPIVPIWAYPVPMVFVDDEINVQRGASQIILLN